MRLGSCFLPDDLRGLPASSERHLPFTVRVESVSPPFAPIIHTVEVRIAVTEKEAGSWSGTAVVIDVIRFSGTAAALLKAGREIIRIHGDPAILKRDLKRFPDCDLFSEKDLGTGAPALGDPPLKNDQGEIVRFDNSPHAAGDATRRKRPALILTGTGSRAVLACQGASTILIAGFCNFSAALDQMRLSAGPILLVPAALMLPKWVSVLEGAEDAAGADCFQAALNGQAHPETHLARLWRSERPAAFRKERPLDNDRDLNLVLSFDTILAVPRVVIENGVGVVIRGTTES